MSTCPYFIVHSWRGRLARETRRVGRIAGAAGVSDREARRRMRSMRKRVRTYDVQRWASSFLDALQQPGPGGASEDALRERADARRYSRASLAAE